MTGTLGWWSPCPHFLSAQQARGRSGSACFEKQHEQTHAKRVTELVKVTSSVIRKKMLDDASLGNVPSVPLYLSSKRNQSPLFASRVLCHALEAAKVFNDEKGEGSSTALKEA